MNTTILLRQARQHFPDLDLPAALVDDLAALDLAQQRNDLLRHDPTALAAAVADALTAGKDPATDKTVTTLLARKALAENLHTTAAELTGRRDQVITEHLPALLASLRPIVEDADRALSAARDAIPDLDLTDPTIDSRLRPDQVRPLADARVAADQVGKVAQLWHLAAPILRIQLSPFGPLLLADLTADQFDALPQHRAQRVDTDAAVYAGHRLDMATPDTYRERIARVAERQRQHAEQAEQANKFALMGQNRAAWTPPTPTAA